MYRRENPGRISSDRVLGVLGPRFAFEAFAKSFRPAVAMERPVTVFPQLHEIDGVLCLKAEPAGLALTSELKEELARSF